MSPKTNDFKVGDIVKLREHYGVLFKREAKGGVDGLDLHVLWFNTSQGDTWWTYFDHPLVVENQYELVGHLDEQILIKELEKQTTK